ncbi:MAG: MATE family efflux transporter [Clostridiales bacterium]|jgi:putative MATE family efflux protein|nr:MATE family efflux transporter [Clostridiales bacterium]
MTLNQDALPQNKMAIKPIGKLMLGMGLPMIISMVLQAFYNIVDTYFVSKMPDTASISGMGDYGVTALTLSFPIQMLMIAIGVGTGVGINALLSKSLGQGNREKANRIAGNGIFLGLATYALFLLVGIFAIKAYIGTQTKDAVVLAMGTEYLSICTILSFGAILSMVYEKLLQATGRTVLSTVAQLSGAVTNIILDPIMIFGYLGCPALGIQGAAYATVIGQLVTFVLTVIFHHTLNKDLNPDLKYIKPDKGIVKEIYRVGLPAIVMQALMSFMTYGVNIIFVGISEAAVTAYGVYYKIQQFVFFAAFGMNNAIIPIVAFNYGMQDKKRVKEGIKYGMLYTLAIMLIGLIVLQASAAALAGIFALSKDTVALCVTALRVITVGYLFAGANIAFQGIFQAFGKGVHSLIVSLIRLIVVTLPLAYLFTLSKNPQATVWWAFPIAELCALIAAIIFMKGITKEKIDNLELPIEIKKIKDDIGTDSGLPEANPVEAISEAE